MASAPIIAQNYIECENCEKKPAQFLCKTCPGHLCEPCKSTHKKRKIFQNHDVIELNSETRNILELMHCSEHRSEKLKCYCSRCRTPICTQCMVETHNGHRVEKLDSVYSRIRNQLRKENEEIEATLLPKYKELLDKERQKKADISKRTDDVQKQIENHTENILQRFTGMKKKRVKNLQQETEKALQSVANSETEIQRRIKALNEIKTQISHNLGEKPGIIYFKAINDDSFTEMRRYPNSIEYKLDNFSPGDIEGKIQDIDFGNVPSISMVDSSERENDVHKEYARENAEHSISSDFDDEKPQRRRHIFTARRPKGYFS